MVMEIKISPAYIGRTNQASGFSERNKRRASNKIPVNTSGIRPEVTHDTQVKEEIMTADNKIKTEWLLTAPLTLCINLIYLTTRNASIADCKAIVNHSEACKLLIFMKNP